MNRFKFVAAGLLLAPVAFAGGKPLASLSKFDGKFQWIKLPSLPANTLKSFATAKSLLVDVTFARPVKLKKDKNGNIWLTFVVADQGSDWAWHQTTGSGAIPAASGSIPAGTYTVKVPLAGIPAKVLADKKQTLSIGPAASALSAPTSITIDRVRTSH